MNVNTVIFFFTLLLIHACNPAAEKKRTSENLSDQVPDTTTEKYSNSSDSVLRVVTIKSHTGAEGKEKPDNNSKTLNSYKYGDQMDVIGETAEWWIVRDYVKRVIKENSQIITRHEWEKVYLSKSATIDLSEVRIQTEELNIVSSINEGDSIRHFQNGLVLNKYLRVELVDQKTFDENRSTGSFTVPAPNVTEEGGIIELPCKNKTVRYIDRPDDEENRCEYNFVGEIPFLNTYVIAGSYYEGSDFKFIDKDSGRETQVFVDFPFISPDKKQIICIYSNPYNATADLELFAIQNKKVKKVVAVSYQYWMPLYEDHKMFWGRDGFLYLTALPAQAFWDKEGKQNTRVQHLRIKVL